MPLGGLSFEGWVDADQADSNRATMSAAGAEQVLTRLWINSVLRDRELDEEEPTSPPDVRTGER